jgi:hypothetical protein
MRLIGLIVLLIIVIAVYNNNNKTASTPSAAPSASTPATPTPTRDELVRQGHDKLVQGMTANQPVPAAPSTPSARSAPSTSTQAEKPKPKEKEVIPPPGTGEVITEAYYKQVWDDALMVCKKAVERSATYDLRWTKIGVFGTPLPMFDRWNKHQRQDGHILFYGDEAEAQNGLGNWVRVNYRCEFDPAEKKVMDAQLNQGRMRD